MGGTSFEVPPCIFYIIQIVYVSHIDNSRGGWDADGKLSGNNNIIKINMDKFVRTLDFYLIM